MKKIIAMLLCVALVAAMSVSAFAASPKGTEVWDVEKWLTELSNKEASTGLKAIAENLAGAKKAYADNLKAYNDGIKDAIKAVQAAQYATVAAYIEVATEFYAATAQNEINKAIAQFTLDLKDAINPVAASSDLYDLILAEAKK